MRASFYVWRVKKSAITFGEGCICITKTKIKTFSIMSNLQVNYGLKLGFQKRTNIQNAHG